MKLQRIRHHKLWDVLAGAAILAACNLLFPGCTFDTSGVESSAVTRLVCKANVWEYGTLPNGQPGFNVTKKGNHSTVVEWKPFKSGVVLYGNKTPQTPWKPLVAIPTSVKGSYLLQVHSDDGTSKLDPLAVPADFLLKLAVKNQSIDGIWIGYDRRALSVPKWLRNDFKLPANFEVIPTTVIDPKTGWPVAFRLWQPKNLTNLLERDHLLLGGNDADGVSWRDNLRGEQYLVLVRMKVGLDITKKTKVDGGKVDIEYCVTNCTSPPPPPNQDQEDRGTAAALENWVADHANYKNALSQGRIFVEQNDATCDCVTSSSFGSTCQKVTAGDGSHRFINAWARSSFGAIDASSSRLTVEVIDVDSGAVTGSGVAELDGEIEFHIDGQSNVQIGGLTMYGKNVTLSDGTYLSEISIGQDATIVADCNDGLPPGPFRLCRDYQVPGPPEPGFQASAFCRVNGNEIPVVLANAAPMPLTVDLNTMTFLMVGGPLEGRFTISGTDYLVRIRIDMGGYFTSLAPVASIDETGLYWECGDNGIANVVLNGSASTDDLHPGSIISYKWVEDEGALTETVLGTTQIITTPMIFGVHDVTLKVQDSDMVWNSLDFEVGVVDSQIDSVSAPSDIWRLIAPGSGGDHVEVGGGSGSDICSGQVRVTNDADPSGWYPTGLTVVNWRFDDFHGNIVDHPQKIFLVEPQFYPPPVSTALVLLDHIDFGQVQEISHETQSQGLAVQVDEFITIYGPHEFVASIAWGEVIPDEIVANQTDVTFGIESSVETVYEGVISDSLPEPGVYTVVTSLVVPGGHPNEASGVVAVDWASFSLGDEW